MGGRVQTRGGFKQPTAHQVAWNPLGTTQLYDLQVLSECVWAPSAQEHQAYKGGIDAYATQKKLVH